MSSAALVLHGYWRSSASYRTRIALNLKGLEYAQRPVNLIAGEQGGDAYRALNPQALVPALEAGGRILTQSAAILEWLDERYPDPPLLPRDPDARAIVRAMAMMIACDVQPLGNLRVLEALKHDLGASDAARHAWVARWVAEGFAALEPMIARYGRGYAFGGSPGSADCYLVPQVYSAERFNVPLDAYPNIRRVVAAARTHPAFAAAHPDRQSDAPAAR